MTSIPVWKGGVEQLAPGVYAYLQPKGGWGWSNAGIIVGEEYVVVVDSLFTVDLTEKLLAEIRRITDKPVRYLLNTHHHGDHVFGNHLFRDATTICHDRCGEEMIKALRETPDPTVLHSVFPEFGFRGARTSLPDVTFDKELVIHQGQRQIKAMHIRPAHTVGDVVVQLPGEDVVFAGDVLFLFSTPVCMDGHFAGWIQTLADLAALDAKVYVPGHGPACNRSGVLECREYLALIYGEARKRFEAGIPAREAALSIDLGRFRAWANPERILANVECLYREFRGEHPLSETDLKAIFAGMNDLARTGW